MTAEDFEADMAEIAAAGGGLLAILEAGDEMLDLLIDELLDREARYGGLVS